MARNDVVGTWRGIVGTDVCSLLVERTPTGKLVAWFEEVGAASPRPLAVRFVGESLTLEGGEERYGGWVTPAKIRLVKEGLPPVEGKFWKV